MEQTEVVSELDVELKMQGIGGHTSLHFKDKEILMEWKETTLRERRLLAELITMVRSEGMKTFSVNDKDEAEEITDDLPGVFFGRKGKMILRNESGKIDPMKIIAKGIIDAEIKDGRLTMEATKSGEWKILRVGDFELKKGEKQVVKTVEKGRGG
jgi:hypothetical protein